MSAQLFLARQPILDVHKHIVAYELFYRDEEGSPNFSDARLATSSVLVNVLNQIGLQNSVGHAKAFVNISANLLLTEIIPTLPIGKFVFELNQNIEISNKLRDIIEDLNKKGYEFALDNVNCSDAYFNNFNAILPFIKYLKFDTTMTDIEYLQKQMPRFKGKKLVAQKVEIPEVYEAYKAIGFDYFQGYFFAKPHIIQKNRMDPKHKGVIHIFNMLQTDAPLNELAAEFEKHNELTLQLLQFLNSTSLFDLKEATSISEIVQLVGKEKLLQWLLLIIYSKSGKEIKSNKSPLSLLAQHRVDIMLGILEKTGKSNYERYKEEVRYVAMLSLLESVFNVPLAYVLENFEVGHSIESALLSHSGVAGRLLAIEQSIEKADFATTQVLLRSFNLTVDDIDNAMLESFIHASTL